METDGGGQKGGEERERKDECVTIHCLPLIRQDSFSRSPAAGRIAAMYCVLLYSYDFIYLLT